MKNKVRQSQLTCNQHTKSFFKIHKSDERKIDYGRSATMNIDKKQNCLFVLTEPTTLVGSLDTNKAQRVTSEENSLADWQNKCTTDRFTL